MNDEAVLDALFKRLDFNEPTRAYMHSQGMKTMRSFTKLPPSQVEKMIKHSSSWKPPQTPDQPDGTNAPIQFEQVDFPFMSVRALIAVRNWAAYRVARGEPCLPTDFTEEAEEKWTERTDDLDEIREAAKLAKGEEGTIPKLSVLDEWSSFIELFHDHLGSMRDPKLGAPLTFVIRDKEVPDQADLDAEYDSVDDDLVATLVLEGPTFNKANKRVFAVLKKATVKGAGWTFIKKYDVKSDGRGAFLALKKQATGESAVATIKAKAYAAIQAAVYHGNNSKYTFARYVQAHQEAHNTLEDEGEPIPETKKVQDFLDGIKAAHLESGRVFVEGDNARLTNFTACQQYMSTLVVKYGNRNKGAPAKRQVALVKHKAAKKKAGKPAKKGGGKSAKPAPTKSSGVAITHEHYTPADYAKLTAEERDEVRRLRTAVEAEQRQVAVVMTDTAPPVIAEIPTEPPKLAGVPSERAAALMEAAKAGIDPPNEDDLARARMRDRRVAKEKLLAHKLEKKTKVKKPSKKKKVAKGATAKNLEHEFKSLSVKKPDDMEVENMESPTTKADVPPVMEIEVKVANQFGRSAHKSA